MRMRGFGSALWVAAAATLFASAAPGLSQASAGVACGAASVSTAGAVEEIAAKDIYDGENVGPEVHADAARITSATDLSTAVANNDQTAVQAAVTRIVFTPHWHIVRLRVLSSSGRLLADVGGPYVIAPVTGQITSHGTVVGTYVMSVQDDVGYEKLVNRFTGMPIELYLGGHRIMGRRFPQNEAPPAPPANGTPMTVNGHASNAISYTANAFPSGALHVLLAVPRPSAALAAKSCTVVSVNTYGSVAEHIASLYPLPSDYTGFITTAGGFGPKFIFVRSGSTQIAGTFPNGPSNLPVSGPYVFNGQTFNVFSFEAVPPARIYLMFSAPAAGGGTGPSGTTGTSGAT